jgi:hypothetical protein
MTMFVRSAALLDNLDWECAHNLIWLRSLGVEVWFDGFEAEGEGMTFVRGLK